MSEVEQAIHYCTALIARESQAMVGAAGGIFSPVCIIYMKWFIHYHLTLRNECFDK